MPRRISRPSATAVIVSVTTSSRDGRTSISLANSTMRSSAGAASDHSDTTSSGSIRIIDLPLQGLASSAVAPQQPGHLGRRARFDVSAEKGCLLEAGQPGHKHVRKALDAGIEIAHRAVVEAPRVRELILDLDQLAGELLEALGGLEIRIVLGQ